MEKPVQFMAKCHACNTEQAFSDPFARDSWVHAHHDPALPQHTSPHPIEVWIEAR